MKHSLILLALITISTLSFSQPTIQWQYSYGGTDVDGMNQGNGGRDHVQQTNDGGFIVAAHSYSNDGDVTGHHGPASSSDYWVFKIDSLGNLEWQQSYGGTANDQVNCIQNTSDGGYILVGETVSNDGDVTGFHGTDPNIQDVWVVKLDSVGNIQWERAYGGTGNENGRSIIETYDGGYVFAAGTDSVNGDISGIHHGLSDIWLVKIDAIGNILWQKLLGGSSFEFVRSVRQTNDNGLILAGNTSSSDGDAIGNTDTLFLGGTWVIKTDSLGNIEWQDTYGGTSFEFGDDILQTANGNYIFGVHTFSTDGDVAANHHGSADYWVLKLDPVGNIIWSSCYGGSDSEDLHSLKLTNDGGFMAVGQTFSTNGDITFNNGGFDYWVIKCDSLGNLQWQKSLGGSSWEFGKTMVLTNDGGTLVVGESPSNDGDVSGHHGSTATTDVWVVKLSPVITNISEPAGNIASISVSPNPVNNIARLQFELLENDQVQIDLLDISGRIVQSIINNRLNAGINSLDLNATGLANGLYLIRISTGKSNTTIKFIKN